MLFKLYIGSNNKTGKLEKEKAVKLASVYFQGFTAYKGIGYWEGKKENSLIIEIETNEWGKVEKLASDLKKELKQDAIGLARIGSLSFI